MSTKFCKDCKHKENIMILTDKELSQLAISLNSRLCSRDTYWTKGTARVFNNLLNKVRQLSKGRKNERNILMSLGDKVED